MKQNKDIMINYQMGTLVNSITLHHSIQSFRSLMILLKDHAFVYSNMLLSFTQSYKNTSTKLLSKVTEIDQLASRFGCRNDQT